jgi:hypothetical protein
VARRSVSGEPRQPRDELLVALAHLLSRRIAPDFDVLDKLVVQGELHSDILGRQLSLPLHEGAELEVRTSRALRANPYSERGLPIQRTGVNLGRSANSSGLGSICLIADLSNDYR